jgi:hypothetical protein
MTARRTSRHVRTLSRHSSSVRRAEVAAATATTAGAQSALNHLVAHLLAKAAGRPRAARRLATYAHSLRARGLGELVSLANAACLFDGGRMLRQLATSADPESVERALVLYVQIATEHRVQSTSALALVLRSCLQGAVLDRALVYALNGKWAKAATLLDAPARLNLMSGLALEKQADEVRKQPAPFDLAGRIAQLNAEEDARRAAAPVEDEEHAPGEAECDACGKWSDPGQSPGKCPHCGSADGGGAA